MSDPIPENKYVTDTMALVLRLEERKMGMKAREIFALVESGRASLYIPALVFAEILYLAERKRISISLREVREYLTRYAGAKEYPLDLSVIEAAGELTDIPELHDRLIAGTSTYLDLDLITNDPVIQASSFVRTIW